MDLQERPHQPHDPNASGDGFGDGGQLRAQRREGESLLNAADKAINDALSKGDSLSFVESSEQRSGQ